LHNNAGSSDPSRLWFVEDHGLGRKEPALLCNQVDFGPTKIRENVMDCEAATFERAKNSIATTWIKELRGLNSKM
jgi:hypothetical protein